jgi:predicted nucleic acid-binding protein
MPDNPKTIDTTGIRSDSLPTLRGLLDSIEILSADIGPIARFDMVVDANILISEILWHASKRRSATARTKLQECIAAGTISAYATPQVVAEVHEHLLRISVEKGLDHGLCLEIWSVYERKLTIQAATDETVQRYAFGQDPDDAPSLALADDIKAIGIYSNDTDIAAMGGNTISVQFIAQARDYSRDAAISVHLQIGGRVMMLATMAAVYGAFKGLKALVGFATRLPTGAKLALLFFGLVALNSPKTRQAVSSKFSALINGSGNTLGEILTAYAATAEAAEKHKPQPLIPPTRPQ